MSGSNSRNSVYIIMVGLPARGKSTMARKLMDNLRKDRIRTRIFNNGDLRRKLSKDNTSYADFFDSHNSDGVALREKYALINMRQAKRFLERGGRVAILDATNVSRKRRQTLEEVLGGHNILYVECINNDEEILADNIDRKVCHHEFSDLTHEEAVISFCKRIEYYKQIYQPLERERNYIKFDSFHRRILSEELTDGIPHYARIRDFLVTETIQNLYLIRHPETTYNLDDRIGGDPPLTPKGMEQANALARFFRKKSVPIIFTSAKHRTIETARIIAESQQHSDAHKSCRNSMKSTPVMCEELTYQEIREKNAASGPGPGKPISTTTPIPRAKDTRRWKSVSSGGSRRRCI